MLSTSIRVARTLHVLFHFKKSQDGNFNMIYIHIYIDISMYICICTSLWEATTMSQGLRAIATHCTICFANKLLTLLTHLINLSSLFLSPSRNFVLFSIYSSRALIPWIYCRYASICASLEHVENLHYRRGLLRHLLYI